MKLRRETAEAWSWHREQTVDEQAVSTVARIVAQVQTQGDAAVRRCTAEFDGLPAAAGDDWGLRVPAHLLRQAWEALDPALQEAWRAAAARIHEFHARQRPEEIQYEGQDGERLGMVWRPLRRVGVYAPGGRAAYPSTVLMNAIPAKVAGVKEIALVSPPDARTGWPHQQVLAAAWLAGVTEVYRIGGAQAVAALAYGTAQVPRVDKVVGPGNMYVALAKRLVMGDVGIDSIAGPSEVFIVADDTADARYVAADMLAQAEHDPEAGAVCVTTSAVLADAVEAALAVQLAQLERREIAAAALARWGAIVLADDLGQAMDVVNRSAPEHVELHVVNAARWLDEIHSAGAVFLGSHTPEPVGDYYAGPNHVLPTHGSARYASGLGVLDFYRRMTFVEYAPQTLRRHTRHIAALAAAEGLSAHARAVEIRWNGEDDHDESR